MAKSIRLEKVETRLNAYYDAEIAILSGQEYKIGSKSLKRADLGQIRAAISELEKAKDELTALENNGGRRKSYRIVPRDL